MRTGVTEVETKKLEEVQQTVKYSSIVSYMLKPSYLLKQGFKENKKAHENIFNHMCNFAAHKDRRNGIISISSYPDVDTRKDQYHLLNPTPLD